jgi:hypothetical protein
VRGWNVTKLLPEIRAQRSPQWFIFRHAVIVHTQRFAFVASLNVCTYISHIDNNRDVLYRMEQMDTLTGPPLLDDSGRCEEWDKIQTR